jgi:hypothetical protein
MGWRGCFFGEGVFFVALRAAAAKTVAQAGSLGMDDPHAATFGE